MPKRCQHHPKMTHKMTRILHRRSSEREAMQCSRWPKRLRLTVLKPPHAAFEAYMRPFWDHMMGPFWDDFEFEVTDTTTMVSQYRNKKLTLLLLLLVCKIHVFFATFSAARNSALRDCLKSTACIQSTRAKSKD